MLKQSSDPQNLSEIDDIMIKSTQEEEEEEEGVRRGLSRLNCHHFPINSRSLSTTV